MQKFLIFLFFIFPLSLKSESLKTLYKKMGIIPIEKKETPQFELEDLSGNKVSLKDYKGKIVFLNFWASWCPACRIEMPSMEKLWQKFKDKDFVIVAVDLGEPKEKVLSFIKQNKLTFPVLLDKKQKTMRPYQITAIPTTYIIDRDGKIIGKAIGAREWDKEESIKLFEFLLKDKKEKKS